MKKLTQKEFDALPRRGGSGWCDIFRQMKVGEIIEINKDEWKLSATPSSYLGNYRQREGMDWESRPTENGWAVKKTK